MGDRLEEVEGKREDGDDDGESADTEVGKPLDATTWIKREQAQSLTMVRAQGRCCEMLFESMYGCFVVIRVSEWCPIAFMSMRLCNGHAKVWLCFLRSLKQQVRHPC